MMQYYGLSGRKTKPNYRDIVNAGADNLPARRAAEETKAYQDKTLTDTKAYQDKTLTDTEAYRNKTLALEADRMAQEERFAKDTLDANEKANERSNLIGLGQLGVSAYRGRTRDNALKEVLAGGGEKGNVSGAITPTVSGGGATTASPDMVDAQANSEAGSIFGLGRATTASPDMVDAQANSEAGSIFGLGAKDPEAGIWEGIKGGAGNWGDIALGAGAGATIGANLGEKYISKNDTGRAIGGAVTAGALSYLTSGNPYTSAISALFGGALGAIL